DGAGSYDPVDASGESRAPRACGRSIHLVGERAAFRRGNRLRGRRCDSRVLALARRARRKRACRVACCGGRVLAATRLSGELLVHPAAARFQCLRQMLTELAEELVVRLELFLPCGSIDARELCVLRRRHLLLETGPGEIFEARHDAKRSLDALRAALAALRDPLQHAHVLAEARPDELAVRV